MFLLLRSWEVKGRRGKNDWFLSRRRFVSEFTREISMSDVAVFLLHWRGKNDWFHHEVASLANLRERLLWIVLADSRIGRFFSFGGNLSSFRASMLLRNEWKCTWSDFFLRALPFVLKQPIRIVLHAWPAWEQKIMKRLSASSRNRSLCVRNFLVYQQRRYWFTIIVPIR